MITRSFSRPTTFSSALVLVILFLSLEACQGGVMDYGAPVAQFEARDAVRLTPSYLGKKVSVRGEVLTVDTSDPARCVVRLERGVVARFGDFKVMAEQCTVGEVVYIDGIVAAVGPAEVILDPALGRDPGAPFDPLLR